MSTGEAASVRPSVRPSAYLSSRKLNQQWHLAADHMADAADDDDYCCNDDDVDGASMDTTMMMMMMIFAKDYQAGLLMSFMALSKLNPSRRTAFAGAGRRSLACSRADLYSRLLFAFAVR